MTKSSTSFSTIRVPHSRNTLSVVSTRGFDRLAASPTLALSVPLFDKLVRKCPRQRGLLQECIRAIEESTESGLIAQFFLPRLALFF